MAQSFCLAKKKGSGASFGKQPHFDSSWFGGVKINGQEYGDVLVIGGKIKPRDEERLDLEVGGHHFIGDFEVEELLANQPEVVVVGTGTAGCVEVSERVRERFEKAGVKLIAFPTPKAIDEFNKVSLQGKRVNALIHVTC